MRIEARDGLLDSSGGEVEQRELAHPTERAPRAGVAPQGSPPDQQPREKRVLPLQPEVTSRFAPLLSTATSSRQPPGQA